MVLVKSYCFLCNSCSVINVLINTCLCLIYQPSIWFSTILKKILLHFKVVIILNQSKQLKPVQGWAVTSDLRQPVLFHCKNAKKVKSVGSGFISSLINPN